MYEYQLELFFYKDNTPENIKKMGLTEFPDFDKYSTETKILQISTWENYRNYVLVDYPEVAYILIQQKRLIVPLDEYVRKYETELYKIKESDIHGLGVFAKNKINKGDEVLELQGEIVEVSKFKGGYPKGEWNALSDTQYLVRSQRTLYGFINHSLQPNAEIDMGRLIVKASRGIRAGDEVTIDYTKEKLSKSYLQGHGATYLFS